MKTIKHLFYVAVASVAAAFFVPAEARAEEPFRQAVRIGWPGYPAFADMNLVSSWFNDSGWCNSSGTMTDIMSDYFGDTRCTGAVLVEYNRIVKKWLTMSVGFGVNHFWKKAYSRLDGSYVRTDNATALYFLPQARFTYFNRKYVRLYSSVSLGLVYYDNMTHGHLFSDCGEAGPNQLNLMIQPVPFGIEVGNKVYGFAELGFGSVWTGLNAGIGFRF